MHRRPRSARRGAPSRRAAPTPPASVARASHRSKPWPRTTRCAAGITHACGRKAARSRRAPGRRRASQLPTPVGALLAVRDLHAWYGRHPVLHDVSIALDAGECMAVVGEFGSGKTTLARCVAGLHPTFSGELMLAGEALEAQARERPRARASSDSICVPEPVCLAQPASHRRPDRCAPAAACSSISNAAKPGNASSPISSGWH